MYEDRELYIRLQKSGERIRRGYTQTRAPKCECNILPWQAIVCKRAHSKERFREEVYKYGEAALN